MYWFNDKKTIEFLKKLQQKGINLLPVSVPGKTWKIKRFDVCYYWSLKINASRASKRKNINSRG